ncbi:ankyrin-3-like isoform X2 [Homarus americanus]|uniref:ankyrin-3-like isoform X2 n=1 Tax=Homarus americanus TaxID=6706 RepID=UPI001C485C40|nr:ankyrin-3-like isoform X2 [Homarus americanus]
MMTPQEVDLEAVKEALQGGVPVDGVETEPGGRTPLHQAAITGNLQLVRLLCDHRADLHLTSNQDEGRTALHLAARAGHRNIVELLLARGAQVNVLDDHGRTPLHLAAEAGHTNIVKSLIECEADVNLKDKISQTVGHYAARGGHGNIIDILQDHGCCLTTLDQDEASLLHLAAESGHLDTVYRLVKVGLSPGAVDITGCTPEDRAQRRGWTNVVAFLQDPHDDNPVLEELTRVNTEDETVCQRELVTPEPSTPADIDGGGSHTSLNSTAGVRSGQLDPQYPLQVTIGDGEGLSVRPVRFALPVEGQPRRAPFVGGVFVYPVDVVKASRPPVFVDAMGQSEPSPPTCDGGHPEPSSPTCDGGHPEPSPPTCDGGHPEPSPPTCDGVHTEPSSPL